eukprot:5893255-Karenia_brevis.AAC.1
MSSRLVPATGLVDCRCGNVHFANRPCWPGFDGQEWCYFQRCDGSRGRSLCFGPQPVYEDGVMVLRCDGACPGQGQFVASTKIGMGAWAFAVCGGTTCP